MKIKIISNSDTIQFEELINEALLELVGVVDIKFHRTDRHVNYAYIMYNDVVQMAEPEPCKWELYSPDNDEDYIEGDCGYMIQLHILRMFHSEYCPGCGKLVKRSY